MLLLITYPKFLFLNILEKVQIKYIICKIHKKLTWLDFYWELLLLLLLIHIFIDSINVKNQKIMILKYTK